MRSRPAVLKRSLCFFLLLAPAWLAGCGSARDFAGIEHDEVPAVAASSSYLAAAVRDLVGAEEPVLVLAEPGMCPGHFDLRPSQVQQMRRCRMLLRFNFQQSLDRRLSDGAADGPQVVSVEVPGGMCEPASYLAVCRQIADALVAQGRLSRSEAEQRVETIEASSKQLTEWAAECLEEYGLTGAAVLSSGHQAAFCQSLGWTVVAEFTGADTAQVSQIDQAIAAGEEAGVRLIIANRPEGRQLADALGERLRARVVVFDNFPYSSDAGGFAAMVRGNIEALAETKSP